MFKNFVALFFTIFSLTAVGQTVIYYEDGSVYTVKPNERVYVETASTLYTKTGYTNGNEFFIHRKPNEKIDYEAQPYNDSEPGSSKWCEEYGPYLYSNGYTWDDQIYLRACDRGDD